MYEEKEAERKEEKDPKQAPRRKQPIHNFCCLRPYKNTHFGVSGVGEPEGTTINLTVFFTESIKT